MLSLNWFKEENQQKYEELIVEEQQLKNEILKEQLSMGDKPYLQVKLVANSLTVVLRDGSILSKPDATTDEFIAIRNARSEDDILRLLSILKPGRDESRKERAAREQTSRIASNFHLIKLVDDFRVEGDVVYLKEINRSLPPLLLGHFLEIIEEYYDPDNEDWMDDLYDDEVYTSLKRFFMWCCLNPRAEVASDLYDFLMNNSFRITKQGFFVALRNVVSLEQQNGDNSLVQFVSNAYNKIKAVWKKRPEDYEVIEQNGEYRFEKTKPSSEAYAGTWKGNLKDLYLDLPNMKENRFTDAHTRTFDIRVGKVVSMPPEDCSWSRADCAHAGLHFTADEIHYVGCGDTSVLILINPMKVVGIGEHKGRCYEYLPIMTVPSDEATEILHDLDFDTLELDEDYAIYELDNLAEKVKDGFTAEASKFHFNFAAISTDEIYNIVGNLDKMRDEISNRVSRIK